MMAATLAEGETVLVNAAREPEIVDLARCLDRDGRARSRAPAPTASASAASRSLHGARHSVIPDRIETGTYMMAAAITGGEVELVGARLDHVAAVARILEGAGVEVARDARTACMCAARNGRLNGVDVMTEPFPAFRPICRRR